MSGKAMNLTLRIWRQDDAEDSGRFETHEAIDVSPDMSFLEMLDVVNEGIIADGNEPIAFDSDCREGICGTCSMVINGVPRRPARHYCPASCICDSSVIATPSRSSLARYCFPVQRDLIVDRSSFDRIQQAGGFIMCAPAAYLTRTLHQCLRRILTSRWMPPSASAAAPACSMQKRQRDALRGSQGLAPQSRATGPTGTRTPRPVHGATDG